MWLYLHTITWPIINQHPQILSILVVGCVCYVLVFSRQHCVCIVHMFCFIGMLLCTIVWQLQICAPCINPGLCAHNLYMSSWKSSGYRCICNIIPCLVLELYLVMISAIYGHIWRWSLMMNVRSDCYNFLLSSKWFARFYFFIMHSFRFCVSKWLWLLRVTAFCRILNNMMLLQSVLLVIITIGIY